MTEVINLEQDPDDQQLPQKVVEQADLAVARGASREMAERFIDLENKSFN